jgi:hypothetical protein
MARYRIETSHWVDDKQVNRQRCILAASDEEANRRFEDIRKADKTIQEGAVFRVNGNVLTQEYIGYV